MSHVISYGSPNQLLINDAISNFTSAAFSARSFCTTPVELLSADGNDDVISHGTGFFWKKDGIDFVVTNWHVLSGLNPFTGQQLSRGSGFVPNRIRVHGWKIESGNGNIKISRSGWTVELGEFGQAAIKNPPQIMGRIIDISAIPLPPDFVMKRDLDQDGTSHFGSLEPCVNLMIEDRIKSQVGDECVIIGYPLRQYTGIMLPIWKKGSISTDTNMAVDHIPAFLIDAATSPAMSGSPVFRSVRGDVIFDKTSGTISEHSAFQFVGIYAGRLENSDLERVNVGYVWFANKVDEAVRISWDMWLNIAEHIKNKTAVG